MNISNCRAFSLFETVTDSPITNDFVVQYSPKIMHAQEVAQEVLAPQEHASGQKKLNCGLSARSSKRKKFEILTARSRKKLRV